MTDSIQHSVLMIYKPYGLMIYAHLTVAMICNRFTVDDIQCFALMRYGRAGELFFYL